MAKIRFLGTCSGTEPFENMHHTAFTVEEGGRIYWFDAGENCSRNAFLAGVDMLKINSIFISHPHEDHIGGLFNLIQLIRQQMWRKSGEPIDGHVNLFLPHEDLWRHMKGLITVASGQGFFDILDIRDSLISDGLVFENQDIRVSAVHNAHILDEENAQWQSFSFAIGVSGKKVVYSGDIRKLCELDPLIAAGCDCLIIESGHQKVAEILEYAESKKIEKVIFNHHGREIINDREAAESLVKGYSRSACIAYDGMIVEI